MKDELAAAFIVSQVELSDGAGETASDMEGLSITVQKADGEKCERCWAYSTTVGECEEHPTLCARCAAVVKNQ